MSQVVFFGSLKLGKELVQVTLEEVILVSFPQTTSGFQFLSESHDEICMELIILRDDSVTERKDGPHLNVSVSLGLGHEYFFSVGLLLLLHHLLEMGGCEFRV